MDNLCSFPNIDATKCIEWIKEFSSFSSCSRFLLSTISPSQILYQYPKQNLIITSPLGSGKSFSTAKFIAEKVRLGQTIMIVCPRIVLCKQFFKVLKTFGCQSFRYYSRYRSFGKGVNITLFEHSENVFEGVKKHLNLVVVDEFHALDADESFRRKQNQVLRDVLNKSSVQTILLSATPTPKSLHKLNIKPIHIILTTPETKTIVPYITSSTLSTLILMLSKIQNERVVVFNDNRKINGELASLFAMKGKKTLTINSHCREKIFDWSGYDIIFTTNISGAGLSIEDSIPTRIIINASHDGIASVVQKIGRVRSNVTEFSVLVPKLNCEFYESGSPSFNNPFLEVPSGWNPTPISRNSSLTRWVCKREDDFKLRKILFAVSADETVRDFYNMSFAGSTGFKFGVPSLEYLNLRNVDINVYGSLIETFLSDEIRSFEKYPRQIKDSCIAASLLFISSLGGKVPPGVDLVCNILHSQYGLDPNTLSRISQRFSEEIQCASALPSFIEEVEEIAYTFLLSVFFNRFDPQLTIDIPQSLVELITWTSRKRKFLLKTLKTLIVFLYSKINPELEIPKGFITPSQSAAVELALRFYEKYNNTLNDNNPYCELSPEIIKAFIRENVTSGTGWLFGGKSVASNLTHDYINMLYNSVSQLLQLFSLKIKRHYVYYLFSREGLDFFDSKVGEMILFKIDFIKNKKSHLPQRLGDIKSLFLCPVSFFFINKAPSFFQKISGIGFEGHCLRFEGIS